jgi:hypothetical protein
MKTKTTQIMKTQLTIALCAITMFFSFTVNAQTQVYNELTSSGMFPDPNGALVANPLPLNSFNSSATCVRSATSTFGKLQIFPSGGYTPVAGARLYFSVYNPSNALFGQVKFEYGTPDVPNDGGDIYYGPASVSGWVEYSISLTPNVGNTISKILLYPSGSSAVAVFVDNIYFHTTSIYPTSGATHFFKDAVEHGSIFNSGVTIVNNPLSNAINSSAKCLKTNGTGAWRETQINAVRYVIKTGDNMFISFYNPNNAVLWQLRFDFHDGEYIGPPDIEHVSAAASGWNEVSVDLTPYIGREIKQIKVLAAHSELKVVNYDNIYISNTSVLSTNSVTQINDQVSVSKEGQIQFNKEQTNTNVSVFDIAGRLIFDEKINGVKGEKALNQKGIYILKVKSEKGVSSQKVIF